MSCARLTDFRFNHNLASIEGKSNSIEVGSLVHHVLEIYYKLKIENKLSNLDCISQAIESGRKYYSELQNVPLDDQQYQTGLNRALEVCNEYFEYYRNDHWTPLSVEQVKGKVIYEDNDLRVLWKAKIDLEVDTNQGIYPVDHKTMKQRRDTVSLNNQFMGQCIVMDTRSTIINKIGFQTSLKPSEKFMRVVVSYTKDRLEEWCNEIVPFYANLYLQYAEMNNWPPNFTHCENKYGVCQFKDVCEADRTMREEVIRMNFKVIDKWDVQNVSESIND
jgi:PD-(D/E)XK nuclease superfamily protein